MVVEFEFSTLIARRDSVEQIVQLDPQTPGNPFPDTNVVPEPVPESVGYR